MKIKRWGMLAAAATLALAACGGDDSASDDPGPDGSTVAPSAAPDPSTGDDTPADGGSGQDCTATEPGTSLDYGVYAPTSSLDPLQSSGALVGGTDLIGIYDVLMRWDPETNEWEPHVAESLTSNDDFTVWTLTLRDGVTYSNGDEMVAQDVVDNMQRMLGPGRNASRGMIARIDFDNTTVVDEHTVEFTLFKPWSTFPMLLADVPGMIVNPALGAATDSAGETVISTDPDGAGAGPYAVERYAPGESPYLVLTARPDYWGGAPCIETINFINIPTDQPKLEALQQGELDVAFFRTQHVIDDARESGEFNEHSALQSAGVVLFVNQGVGNFNPVAQDVRFRKAAQLALDKDALSARGYGGALKIQNSLVHPDSVWYSDGLPELTYDPDTAKSLVEELKAEGWDGKIRLICPNTVPDAPVAYEAALEAVGMEVDTTIADTNTHIAAMNVQQDFDLGCSGLALSDSVFARQIGFNFASDSPSNRVGYSNPEFDAAIDEFYAAGDLEARRAAVRTMGEIWTEDVPVLIAGAVDESVMMADSVSGVVMTQQSMMLLQDASVES